MLHLRKSLLQAVLGHLRWQESSIFSERIVLLFPAAVYALCAGHAPFECKLKDISSSSLLNVAEAFDGRFKGEDDPKIFDCSVEALARINSCSGDEVYLVNCCRGVRLPRQLRDQLLHDMEIYIQGALVQDEIKCRPLQDVIYVCALYANLIYGSVLTRQKEEVSPFLSKMVIALLELLDCATALIEETQNSFHSQGCLGPVSLCDGTSSILSSFRIFVSSPIFTELRNEKALDAISYCVMKQSMERLLRAIIGLYEGNICKRSPQPDMDFSAAEMPESVRPIPDNISRIMDMELDVDADFKDADIFSVGGKVTSGLAFSMEKWKLGMVSLLSCFLTVLHEATWNILYDLMKREENSKVHENMLHHICQQPCWSSSENVSRVVEMIDDMMKEQIDLKLDCHCLISDIRSFIGAFLSSEKNAKKERQHFLSLRKEEFDQDFTQLGELVMKVAEVDLLDWSGRVKLVDSICDFILLCPKVGQMLIERLLLMLRDSDYRVRVCVARRIGVLFQTWEGHMEMFQDICSNFGFPLVCCLKGKVIVSAREVLAAAPQPRQIMETVIATLMHIALHSEIIEMEALFMVCVISAIDPCQRELVSIVLDSISKELQYACRSKYLEEVLGSMIFNWVACNVNLAALVEIRRIFVSDAEPSYFMQYCWQWLLPALILHDESHNQLSWLAQLVGQRVKILVRNHFVPIFAVCIALHCSRGAGSEKGGEALQRFILQFAEISETERDKLIRKHMVSIVSHVLSLVSNTSEPTIPFFPMDTIVRAIQTVVDGFLDMGEYRTGAGVIDKINIFRPDRVFMFIVEIHHKITAAVHHRHKCHRLAGMEVLVEILGHRTAVVSTLNYLLNLTGQYIGCHAVQDQCCRIISSLLDTVENNVTSKEIICVLGEQLQFLVSKLVESCCLSSPNGEISQPGSSQVLSVLHRLTLRSDPSLHDYITELEPFPVIDMLGEIRKFHEDLCQDYSLRDHLLNFVKRSCYLPPRLLLWSLQALHKKFLAAVSFQREWENGAWHEDQEVVQAVWTLVRICASDDADGVRMLVSDFISRVGIGDPHCVVFHLPEGSSGIHVCEHVNSESASEVNFTLNTSISDELLVALLKLLKKYLMDDSVVIVDMTSQVLRGILSTERGQSALLSFGSYERSLIEIHSRGVNMEVVEKLLSELEQKFKAEAMPLEKSSTWETHGKTFEAWICPLAFSLIGHCNDVILRLCQDIVLLKADVCELLLPSIMVDLARRKDLDRNLHRSISSQVQEHIFVETNNLIKSVQVFLNALNELRICYVIERSTSVTSNRESSKLAKPSSYGSRTRSASTKNIDHHANSLPSAVSTSSWEKVYWLYIDYLVVAKSALVCGSYFTSVMYVEYWCEENFDNLTLGTPDFSPQEVLRPHVEILVSAVTQINEPDSLYGIIQTHNLTSQIVTFEHEANWSKALEYYDLQVRSEAMVPLENGSRSLIAGHSETSFSSCSPTNDAVRLGKPYKGLIRSLQQIGCTHVLDLYCQGLTSRKGQFEYDLEFAELQYEAAWRAGNWDFSLLSGSSASSSSQLIRSDHFNESLHCCLRALREGDLDEFLGKLKRSKQELVLSVSHASEESTEYIYSTIIKLQILCHLGTAWNLRWTDFPSERSKGDLKVLSEPVIPTIEQMTCLNSDWESILRRTQLHMNLLEPFLAFRRVLLNILNCKDCLIQHLLQSASTLRKGARFSLATAALHDLKYLAAGDREHSLTSYWLGRLEEAKLLRAQGQNEMAISLANYISQNSTLYETSSDVYRLIGKWLAETRSSNSRTILESYLKPAVALAEDQRRTHKGFIERQNQTHFHLAHYADALFKSYEDRLTSNEWQAAMRLRKHKTLELEALIRRLKSSTKGEKTDYSVKILELQRQLAMDKEEAERLQDDRDNFLSLALEGYKRCLVIGDKYDVRVVFRLVSLWFSLSSRQNVINNMLSTIEEVQSYKFVPLAYQIASRMGGSKEGHRKNNFQFALVSLLKKMSIDHPYHSIFQLLALANGDRIKDKQRSKSSFIVDMDKKLAAENLLKELYSYHGDIISQMKQMVEVYIKLAELEIRREDTSKTMKLPRDIRSVQQLELVVPVVTATIPVDRSCQYREGTFPHFKGLEDSIMVMNGVNAPKVVECLGSDGQKYRQLAKSGNDDLRQDAVMEQFFGLVNTFLQNHQDTRRRRLGVRTYKVVPFTPSAGVLEWVNGTVPLGDYLIGSNRNGGAHARYGKGDWTFPKCREHMSNAKDKRKAFQEVCENFRPVMHNFFLERFLLPSDWFEKRLAYTRSVATSSMVGYIVGLGDRHSMNILVDQATAEVVHIDLGVAFEQGLMLKTPERVPFRLTRDLIDGMGVTGVEGVFRRCCEETLSVMRTNKEALLTIVEVFIHDPLYKWALSPLKALQRQKETDDDLEMCFEGSREETEGNKDAARALMRVKQKLDGYEGGEMRSLHGQVQQLIQDAIDPERLCQMFPGWGAWL
ncbi:serine/threonine-protein kinase ATM isoform X2 [Punica granatum]|nr:serine/threonine-protein kinase ATM isoform X2 [Punica granatum]